MMLSPLTPYLAGAAILASVATGYIIRDWQCDAALAKVLEDAAEQQEKMRIALDERSRAYEAARDQAYGLGAARATDIRTIYRQIPAPPVDCRAPDDVVRLLQNGIDHANAVTTGKSGDAVPDAK